MPKPLPSTYPKHQRWRFIQRAITSDELVAFAHALVDSSNTNLDQSLPDILHFVDPQTTDIDTLKDEWLAIWVNIMHQGGLGYTVTSKTHHETRVFATDLSKYVVDTENTAAYYYYWALRFQYPFSFPKHYHYIEHKVAVQPVVLICQHLDLLERIGQIKDAYLDKYEIAHFLMRSSGHSESVIRNNCIQILANRKRKFNYEVERKSSEFEETAEHLFSRGRLYIGNFDLLTFLGDRITVANTDTLSKLRTFLSYVSQPFPFKANSQDIRNEFFLHAYSDLDPDPEFLYENVNSKIQNPSAVEEKKTTARTQVAPIKVVNPTDTRGTFGSGTREERRFQQQLRRDTILLYNGRCCVCGLDRREFLIASHIIPVRLDPSIAADRKNCLLLCVLHDRALEKGYFSLLNDYTIVANHNKSSRHPVLVREISKREGQRINLPQDRKLHPSVEYLRRHRIAHGITSSSN